MNNDQPGSPCEDDPGATVRTSNLSGVAPLGEPRVEVALKGNPSSSHVNILPHILNRLCCQLLSGRFHKPCFGWNGVCHPWVRRRNYWAHGEDHSHKLEVPSSNPVVSCI